MPLEVRVGTRTVTLPMADGRGSVEVQEGESHTLDPQSKILRREAHIERFQQYKEDQKKKRKA